MRCYVRLVLNGELASEREEEVEVFKLEEWRKAEKDVEEKVRGGS